MHVTLQDVAKAAGVSPKTVSRVVNNQGEISDATRLRVQAAIEQTGLSAQHFGTQSGQPTHQQPRRGRLGH